MNGSFNNRKLKTIVSLIFASWISVTINLFALQPELIWLGTLGGNYSEARAISADGSVVVGAADDANGNPRAFRWTAATGLQDLGTLGGDWSEATDISADGTVIVGWSYDSNLIYRAFKWTAAYGMQDLGAGNWSKAYGIAADGSTIIVDIYPSAYRWTQAGGFTYNIAGNFSQGRAVSGNGSIIVGDYGDGAFRLTNAGGLLALNHVYSNLLTAGSDLYTALGISSNGLFIVGQGTNGTTSQDEGFLLATYGINISTTTLTADAVSGSQSIEVSSTNGFQIGDNIKINPGELNEEDNVITGFGSFLLQNPLQCDHFIGETVINMNPTAVEQTNLDIPSDYALLNNYPNPFNPSTTISFSIPEEEFVSLKVFNSLGEEVAELVNETLSAGSYSASFNASDLTSGVYFYKINTGTFVEIKKMMLIK